MISAKLPVIPAILTDNPEEFARQLAFAKSIAGAVHLDIIDGQFATGLALEVEKWPVLGRGYAEAHLMVESPIDYLTALKSKKVTRAIVHLESRFDLHQLVVKARELDLLIGWAVNLDTDLSTLYPYLTQSTYIQVMGVKPGASGQPQDHQAELAVRFLRSLTRFRLTISVDGGVNGENIGPLVAYGADYLIAASAIFAQFDWPKAYEGLLLVARKKVAQ
ncbi:MAG: hypothetical protein AAB499_00165 [Patescibacteria group bacterium]